MSFGPCLLKNNSFCFSCSETDDDVEFGDWEQEKQPCPNLKEQNGKEIMKNQEFSSLTKIVGYIM